MNVQKVVAAQAKRMRMWPSRPCSTGVSQGVLEGQGRAPGKFETIRLACRVRLLAGRFGELSDNQGVFSPCFILPFGTLPTPTLSQFAKLQFPPNPVLTTPTLTPLHRPSSLCGKPFPAVL